MKRKEDDSSRSAASSTLVTLLLRDGALCSTPLSSFICLSEPSQDPRIHMVGAKIGCEPGDELARAYLGSKGATVSEQKD